MISSMPDSSSRNSIGVLLPMSVAAASASTRNRGVLVTQGERNSRWASSTSRWIARPACLSPSSCAISDRSIPSPALATPLRSLLISSAQSGRRSLPSNASFASLAMPMRSAQSSAPVSARARDLASITKLRERRSVAARQQQLDLRKDLRYAIDFAQQIPMSNVLVARPDLRNEARADAQPQHRGGRLMLPLDANGLPKQTALGRDRLFRRIGREKIAAIAR